MYGFVSEYPELKTLAIVFKELYTISRRIKTVFSSNNVEGLKRKKEININ